MKRTKKKILLWTLDLSVNVAIILFLVLVIQRWLIAPFDVSGASMCNTLNFIDGECVNNFAEKIIINEATYLFNEPERGDIVVFKPINQDDKYFIKRVIGLPGETVEIENGEVFVTKNSKKYRLEEPYLSEANKGKTKAYFGDDFNTFTVPEENYFLMGDNRRASTDSRSCFLSNILEDCQKNPTQAYVPEDQIRGKAWVVWWPLGSIRSIKKPDLELQDITESLEEK